MARPGRPAGIPKSGGRVKGTRNRRSKELADRVSAEGLTMAEIMVAAAREMWGKAIGDDGKVSDFDMCERAGEMAGKAAPYFHARLSTVAHTGKDGASLFDVANLTDDQLVTFRAFFAALAGSAAPSGAVRH